MSNLATMQDRHWFITGGSGGIGRHLAERALVGGDRVTATARRPSSVDDLRQTYGDRLMVEQLDLSRPQEVQGVIDRAERRRPVDIVVNNAGYAVVGAAEEMTVEQVRDQIEVLLIAPMLITRAFLGPMRERGGGRIIQISSLGGQVAIPTHSAYHAGKWGLEGFSESVSHEAADHGIAVTIVEPGGTRTAFGSGMRFTTELAAHRETAVGKTRRQLESLQATDLPNDPARLAAVVYGTTRQERPPLRLVLGVDAHDAISGALRTRLAAVEAQADDAASVAFPD